MVSEKVEESFKFTHIAFSFYKYYVAPTALKIIKNGCRKVREEKQKRKQNKTKLII